ncbi:MAG: iron-containing redox enzyme family protein [Glaciimonas sp.]|nr:iron-containing redox enzyme family protein [Glaciimonas sp.]
MYQDVTNTFVERLRQHPFIHRCRNGSITLPELQVFLAQHAQYSSYFTRYLCALIANLKESTDVLHLAENLAEELGFGDERSEPHSQIFAKMVKDFGIDPLEIVRFPETEKLIATTFHYCRQSNAAYGLGALCLGAEAIVPFLYSDIIAGFTANGITKERLSFFQIHVECDDGHADTMRDILIRMEQENPESTAIILDAAHAMIEARLNFFSGILKGAHQHTTLEKAQKLCQ